ncbi:hypothetical protein Zmor_012795 [Zophobas morio]|uniref:Uncharacterized protein n=1 Tax=Zophobas morio TaxID=2755281 RepID=A0AA38IC29_9CUCU|nr:hypothetical protein Zmor_012795 [Zophobas morio]
MQSESAERVENRQSGSRRSRIGSIAGPGAALTSCWVDHYHGHGLRNMTRLPRDSYLARLFHAFAIVRPPTPAAATGDSCGLGRARRRSEVQLQEPSTCRTEEAGRCSDFGHLFADSRGTKLKIRG